MVEHVRGHNAPRRQPPQKNITTMSAERLTTDDLNDIARAAVDEIHGTRAPASMTEAERDEWTERGQKMFLRACGALAPEMDSDAARAAARAALRS